MTKNKQPNKPTNTFAILSLVFAFLFFPLGFIFGLIALNQIGRTNEEGKGLAITGITLSLIPILISTFLLFSIFIVFVGEPAGNVVVVEDGTRNESEAVEPIQTTQKIKSAKLEIIRVPIQLANLYPIRLTITNTGDVRIIPKFDITVFDGNEKVCAGSPITNTFGTIYSGDKETEELILLGCIFDKNGDYVLRVDMMDSQFNRLDSESYDLEVNDPILKQKEDLEAIAKQLAEI